MADAVLLRGEGLRLTPLSLDDVNSAYLARLNDAEVNTFTEAGDVVHTLESQTAYVRATLATDSAMMWVIRPEHDDRQLGTLRLSAINHKHRRAWMAILLDRSVWGQGVATRSLRLAADHCLGAMGLHKLNAGIYDCHIASRRAFEKAGFEVEAALKDHAWFNGRFIDVMQYRRLAGTGA